VAASNFIVAVRREHQADAPTNWLASLADLEGITVLGASSKRATVAADSADIGRLLDAVGTFARVEPVIEHFPQTEPAGLDEDVESR